MSKVAAWLVSSLLVIALLTVSCSSGVVEEGEVTAEDGGVPMGEDEGMPTEEDIAEEDTETKDEGVITAEEEPPGSETAPPPSVNPSGPIVEAKLVLADTEFEIYDITYLSDGLRVKGYLAQPKALGIYPAIIWNRGGALEDPTLQPANLSPYVRRGYVAVGSQYRGNLGGEGQEEFGGADVNDVLNLIPLLQSLSNVDASRIGMAGHSRGGMMTYIALKEQTLRGTNDIKAACIGAGPTDLFMLAEKLPKLLHERLVPLIGGTPEEVPERYEARSAIYWPEEINVPILIQHGEADANVSVEQSRKLAELLDEHDKVYKLITYPEDDHSLSGHEGGIPEILAWFDKYL